MRIATEHGGFLERCERRLDVPQQLGASPSTYRLPVERIGLDVPRLAEGGAVILDAHRGIRLNNCRAVDSHFSYESVSARMPVVNNATMAKILEPPLADGS